MKIADSIPLVTGSNRGIGKAYVEALVMHGAPKVYAAMRNIEAAPASFDNYKSVIQLIQLDITKKEEVAAVTESASDINLLINNAGICLYEQLVTSKNPHSAREEMEVNYFGTLAMIRAFAPILKKNGGGAIVNINSGASFINIKLLSSYSASRAATFSLTQGVRAELAEQGTRVYGVYPGVINTKMASKFPVEGSPPEELAIETLLAIEEDQAEDLFVDEMAINYILNSLKNNPLDFLGIHHT